MHMIYIGLLHTDGTEPQGSGYCRIGIEGDKPLQEILQGKQLVFPEVTAPGYGVIRSIAAWDRQEGGSLLHTWPMETPLDVHQGVVPLILKGRLRRGMLTQVQPVKVMPKAACSADRQGL